MVTVYVHGGPNPRKITIFLEEAALPYECKLVDVYEGQNRSEEFLRINPNGRLPALLDTDGPDGPILLWESGAILQYLAEKSGQFLPARGAARYEVLKWLHFQVTHAPYLGNAQLYRVMYRDAIPEVIKRFTTESARIYGVLDERLSASPYIGGEHYSIADMAWYPWIEYREWQGQNLADFPHVRRWFEMLAGRPAVKKGASIPWPCTECGPSEGGRRAKALIDNRLHDPAFALNANREDAAMANLGL